MRLPETVLKPAVVALVGALIAALFGWGGNLSARVNAGEKEQAVQRVQMDNVKDNINEIKQDTREIKRLLIEQKRR